MTPRLKRDDVLQVLSRAATVTRQSTLVIVGSAAAVLSLRTVPLALSYTPDVDIYAPDAVSVEDASDAIDYAIGEGSSFHEENGFFAHGVDENTSCMPEDWMMRATRIPVSTRPEVTCVCPDIHDVALAKICAWREKDRDWLKVAYESGLLDSRMLMAHGDHISKSSAPPTKEIRSRVDRLVRSTITNDQILARFAESDERTKSVLNGVLITSADGGLRQDAIALGNLASQDAQELVLAIIRVGHRLDHDSSQADQELRNTFSTARRLRIDQNDLKHLATKGASEGFLKEINALILQRDGPGSL